MKSFLTLSLLVFLYSTAAAQCELFPASIDQGNCGDYSTLASGAHVQSGQTYGICPSSSGVQHYSDLLLNGGTIRICGNASLTGMFDQGNIVVECGATAYFPAGLLLKNNCKLVNYGTVIITGNLVMEEVNNAVFNESKRARLLVNGSINFAQTQAQTGFLRNRGYIFVDNTLDALDGGRVCLSDSSIIVARNMRYLLNCGGPNFRFSYEDAFGNARLYVENTIVLRGILTSSPNIRFLRGIGSSTNLGGCGSFGLGPVTNNAAEPADPGPNSNGCFNCFTLLPVELTSLTAEAVDGHSEIRWTTASEQNNDYFMLYHSHDGTTWTALGRVEGNGTTQTENHYGFTHYQPRAGMNYYRLEQTDFDGYTAQRGVVAVHHKSATLGVYPNPSANGYFHLQHDAELQALTVTDATGRVVPFEAIDSEGGQQIYIASQGYYILHLAAAGEAQSIPLIVGQ
jgi:hypothetical protein